MRAGAWKAAASVDPVILVKEQTLQQVTRGWGDDEPTKHITEPERWLSDSNEPSWSPLQPVWAAMFADAVAGSVSGILSNKSGSWRDIKRQQLLISS